MKFSHYNQGGSRCWSLIIIHLYMIKQLLALRIGYRALALRIGYEAQGVPRSNATHGDMQAAVAEYPTAKDTHVSQSFALGGVNRRHGSTPAKK